MEFLTLALQQKRMQKELNARELESQEHLKRVSAQNILLRAALNALKRLAMMKPRDPFLFLADHLASLSERKKERPVVETLRTSEKLRIKTDKLLEEIRVQYSTIRQAVVLIKEMEADILEENAPSCLSADDVSRVADAAKLCLLQRSTVDDHEEPEDDTVYSRKRQSEGEEVKTRAAQVNLQLVKLSASASLDQPVKAVLPHVLQGITQILETAQPHQDLVGLLAEKMYLLSPSVSLDETLQESHMKYMKHLRAEHDQAAQQAAEMGEVYLWITGLRNSVEAQVIERNRLLDELRLKGKRINPNQWTRGQRVMIERLERKLMRAEEMHMREFLRQEKREKAATKIQSAIRRYWPRKQYLAISEVRRKAATKIQAHTRRFLLQRRIMLPNWLAVGLEVRILDPRLAKSLATSFEFYPGKDSMGNDLKLVERMTIRQMKDHCLQDDKILGFNSTGYMKSKIGWKSTWIPLPEIPRVNNPELQKRLNIVEPQERGLYVKVVPDPEDIIISGIVVRMPRNSFGTVRVHIDGKDQEVELEVREIDRLWYEQYDWDSGNWYYVNAMTGVSSWDPPHIFRSYELMREIHNRQIIYQNAYSRRQDQKLWKYAAKIQATWKGNKERKRLLQNLVIAARKKKQQELLREAAEQASKRTNTQVVTDMLEGFKKLVESPTKKMKAWVDETSHHSTILKSLMPKSTRAIGPPPTKSRTDTDKPKPLLKTVASKPKSKESPKGGKNEKSTEKGKPATKLSESPTKKKGFFSR